jgi:hypothetical protein
VSPSDEGGGNRHRQRFDDLLLLPLRRIEPALRQALLLIAAAGKGVDWVRLTNELSLWERDGTRLRWAKDFLGLKH